MKFNEKMQKLRKENALSQEALAEMLNVSRQAVSKWESGQSYPETENLITLSEIFGVTIDSLIKDGEAQNGSGNTPVEKYIMVKASAYEYEYKSKTIVYGLPLVHINIGQGVKKAKGIIAIGNIATGVLAIGLLSAGFISIGLLSAGVIGLGLLVFGLLFALGTVSVGIFSIGSVAIGIFTLGAVSIGMFSTGAVAVASHIAIGHSAYGHIAVGRVAKGAVTFIDESTGNFSPALATFTAEEVRRAILNEFPGLWNWIINLMTLFLK